MQDQIDHAAIVLMSSIRNARKRLSAEYVFGLPGVPWLRCVANAMRSSSLPPPGRCDERGGAGPSRPAEEDLDMCGGDVI